MRHFSPGQSDSICDLQGHVESIRGFSSLTERSASARNVEGAYFFPGKNNVWESSPAPGRRPCLFHRLPRPGGGEGGGGSHGKLMAASRGGSPPPWACPEFTHERKLHAASFPAHLSNYPLLTVPFSPINFQYLREA